MLDFFSHRYAVADFLKIHKEYQMTIKYYIAYHVQQSWGEQSATPGWGTTDDNPSVHFDPHYYSDY